MGDSVDGIRAASVGLASLESVTGVGGPVLLAAPRRELERGDVLAGRYQIEAVIGNGGSGLVLRAFDRVARSLVALKILRPEFAVDPVWAERFSRELRVGRQIQHINVCRVFDIGEADGNRFLSMELATRGTIRSQLGKEAVGRPLEDRIADARAVIDGVAALHAEGIVHRDLKPENILRMEDGRLVVSDFGLATDPGAGPATTIMIGTPRYMAPEVVMGEPATARSDVWALGIVLHEILFGCRPDRSVVRKGYRLYTPPQAPSLKERCLADLCGRCSDEDANDRPSSAVEVRRQFEAALTERRVPRRSLRRQVVWASIALGAITSLGIVRNRWSNRAAASSPQLATSAKRILEPRGASRDLGAVSTGLSEFEGRVHCLSLSSDNRRARVVWGDPRRVEDIDLETGSRATARLLSETYKSGCPQLSPDGESLLFQKTVDGAEQIYLSSVSNGQGGRHLTRGSSPIWLPNGQEFVFSLDSRHAAVFSIPTRELTVVTDAQEVQLELVEQAIDTSGSRLAILYTTESFGSFLVVHQLPALEVLGHARVPSWARGLRFGRDGREVLFTVPGHGGLRELVGSDLAVSSLHRVAQVSNVDVQGILPTPAENLVLTRTLRQDLWTRSSDGVLRRLTNDGQSVHGALSATGQLLIQRKVRDAKEVIVLRNQNGTEEQVTQGPTDLTPSFLAGGTGWLYARLSPGELVQCSARTRDCRVVHSDPLVPAYPVASPSGRYIAYITALNASRVRLIAVDQSAPQRDLGPGIACGPVWTADDHLWVVSLSLPDVKTWAEIDVASGKRTGQIRTARSEYPGEECPFPRGLSNDAVVIPLAEEKSVLSKTMALGSF